MTTTTTQSTPLFTKFVEIGRVCHVNYGEDAGKLCVILDVIDQNRVLIDGPSDITGVKRQPFKIAYLDLTDQTLPIFRGAKLKALRAAFQKADVQANWAKTSYAKKVAIRKLRAGLNDFDRFKMRILKSKKSAVYRQELAKLKKAHNKKTFSEKTPKLALEGALH